jgi:cysteine desulfurase
MMPNYPDPRYFDYAASCPPFQESLDNLREFSERYFANPSSIHTPGIEAHNLLLAFKKEFCDLVHFDDGRLLLCSSGTEANNTIIEGHLKRFPGSRLLIAEDVHDSIWYATKKYSRTVEIIRIDSSGNINTGHFKEVRQKANSLACISHVCNETGTIHPVSEIAAICSRRNMKLLVDGAQAVGHIPVDLSVVECDYYSFSSHKFGGPRATGGVFIRNAEFDSLIDGGDQEWNLRAGTENPAGLSASVVSLKKCLKVMHEETARLNRLKSKFLEDIRNQVPGILINSPGSCLPGFVSVSFPGCQGHEIVTSLALSGIALSTGSACHANKVEPPRIIRAMGKSKKEAAGTIRVSPGYGTTEESFELLLHGLTEYIKNIK